MGFWVGARAAARCSEVGRDRMLESGVRARRIGPCQGIGASAGQPAHLRPPRLLPAFQEHRCGLGRRDGNPIKAPLLQQPRELVPAGGGPGCWEGTGRAAVLVQGPALVQGRSCRVRQPRHCTRSSREGRHTAAPLTPGGGSLVSPAPAHLSGPGACSMSGSSRQLIPCCASPLISLPFLPCSRVATTRAAAAAVRTGGAKGGRITPGGRGGVGTERRPLRDACGMLRSQLQPCWHRLGLRGSPLPPVPRDLFRGAPTCPGARRRGAAAVSPLLPHRDRPGASAMQPEALHGCCV
jgi:hypothetical protein